MRYSILNTAYRPTVSYLSIFSRLISVGAPLCAVSRLREPLGLRMLSSICRHALLFFPSSRYVLWYGFSGPTHHACDLLTSRTCRLSGSALCFLITYWLRLPFNSNTFGLQAAPCYTGFLNIEFLFVFQYRKGYS